MLNIECCHELAVVDVVVDVDVDVDVVGFAAVCLESTIWIEDTSRCLVNDASPGSNGV